MVQAACLAVETVDPRASRTCEPRYAGSTGPQIVPTKCVQIVGELEENPDDFNNLSQQYIMCLQANGYNLVDSQGMIMQLQIILTTDWHTPDCSYAAFACKNCFILLFMSNAGDFIVSLYYIF